MSAPRVIVLLLSHNDWAETVECLASLAAVEYPNFGVVVVDNASTNPPLDAVRAQYPELVILESAVNHGYAEGNNVGMRYALAHAADYIFVLNNDTIVAPNVLTELVRAAEADPQAAFLGPLVYHFDEPKVIQSAGGFMTNEWRSYHRGQNETDSAQYTKVEPVIWVTGCSILARATALPTIGLLDPAFFIYSEEVDWCLRAGEHGYRVLFVPTTAIWHKGVRRDYHPSPRVTYMSVRNEFLLLRKHHAGVRVSARTWARHLRTLASWSIRPRWRAQGQQRRALAAAMRDYLLRRFGPPPVLS